MKEDWKEENNLKRYTIMRVLPITGNNNNSVMLTITQIVTLFKEI